VPNEYSKKYLNINFRNHPELYSVGKGEQGVLMAEPYKSELLPLWRFKTPEIALRSARALYKKFVEYRSQKDFVGMDMARKFLQMGFTRSRRYANHKSGRKWDKSHTYILPLAVDKQKAESARIFYRYYKKALQDTLYQTLKADHLKNKHRQK